MKAGSLTHAVTFVVGAVLLALSGTADAVGETQRWQFGARINLWFPSLSGTLGFSQPGSDGSIEVDADEIIDALDMTFMGSFEARRGPWSGFTDLIYLDLSGDKSQSVTVPDGSTLTVFDADLELEGWIWTLGGAYTVWSDGNSYVDLLAGARLFSVDTDLKLTGGGAGQADRELSESESIWDLLIGVKGRATVTEHWYFPYYLDVGAGDSDLTWQAAGGFGYALKWGEVGLLYRYLDYDQGSDKLLQDVAFGGPMAFVGFRF